MWDWTGKDPILVEKNILHELSPTENGLSVYIHSINIKNSFANEGFHHYISCIDRHPNFNIGDDWIDPLGENISFLIKRYKTVGISLKYSVYSQKSN